jgi:hypothetical protein
MKEDYEFESSLGNRARTGEATPSLTDVLEGTGIIHHGTGKEVFLGFILQGGEKET